MLTLNKQPAYAQNMFRCLNQIKHTVTVTVTVTVSMTVDVTRRASIEGPDSPVPDDLLRVSVGIEDAGDLIADLERAAASIP